MSVFGGKKANTRHWQISGAEEEVETGINQQEKKGKRIISPILNQINDGAESLSAQTTGKRGSRL